MDPAGGWVAASGDDSGIRSWNLTDTLLDKAQALLWRNLDAQEWNRFIGAQVEREKTFPKLPFPEELR
jgi:hypothetical protein